MGLWSFFGSRQNQDSGKIHAPSRTILLGKLRRILFILIPIGVILLGALNTPHYFPFVNVGAAATSTNEDSRAQLKNLTVVVPGFGDMSRMPVLKQSLAAIQDSLIRSKQYGFSCLVYVYKDAILAEAVSELSFCQVEPNQGLWTHHMKKVPPLDPSLTSHVAVIMDDIDVFSHHLDTSFMLDRMEKMGYNMASSSFPRGSVHREGLHQRAECTSHETGYVDILYTIYDWKSWKCWQDNIDLEINPYGWGYDVLVGDVCQVRIGVIDDQAVAVHVTHPCEKEGGCRKSSYDTDAARKQMEAWIAHASKTSNLIGYNQNVEGTTEAYDYRGNVLARWRQYPRCDDAKKFSEQPVV